MAELIPFGKNALVVFDEFLKARGCEAKDRDRRGYRYLTRDQVGKVLGYDARSDAVAIDYYDAQGAPLLDEGAKGDPYLRLRLLQIDGNGKYRQKRGTHAHARLTPNCRWDWTEVGRTASCPLVVVEGEFKADLANCVGWSVGGQEPCVVGLGGVDSWSGNGSGMVLVPEIQGWDFRDRVVWVCFDADADAGPMGYKPGVLGAMERLASTLRGMGAKVFAVHLGRCPGGGGDKKVGLDDYILGGGKWEQLLATATPLGEEGGDPVRELLGRYGVFERDGSVIDLISGVCWPESRWRLIVADKMVMVVPPGGGKPKATEAAQLWKRRERMMVQGFCQDPTREWGVVTGWKGSGGIWFNRWPGWGRKAVKDEEVEAVWKEFVDRLLGGERAAFFHQWVAWVFQNPGKRNTTSWFLRAETEGIGKSMLFEAVAEAAGRVGRVMGPDAMSGEFNRSLVEGVLLACINELSDGKVDYRRFKHYRTSDSVTMNEKFQPRWEADNYVNFLVTTNEMATHKTTMDARRDIVVGPAWESVGEIGAWQQWLGDVVGPVVRSERGRGGLLWFYLEEVDCAGWNPMAAAPGSAEKDDMAQATEGVPEALARALFERLMEVGAGKGWAVGYSVVRGWCSNEGEGGAARVVMKRLRFLCLEHNGFASQVKIGGAPERVVVGGMTEASWENAASKVEIVRRTAAGLGIRVPGL